MARALGVLGRAFRSAGPPVPCRERSEEVGRPAAPRMRARSGDLASQLLARRVRLIRGVPGLLLWARSWLAALGGRLVAPGCYREFAGEETVGGVTHLPVVVHRHMSQQLERPRRVLAAEAVAPPSAPLTLPSLPRRSQRHYGSGSGSGAAGWIRSTRRARGYAGIGQRRRLRLAGRRPPGRGGRFASPPVRSSSNQMVSPSSWRGARWALHRSANRLTRCRPRPWSAVCGGLCCTG
jgi:hypothetical protein